MKASKITISDGTLQAPPSFLFADVAIGSFFIFAGQMHMKINNYAAYRMGTDWYFPIASQCPVQLVDVTITYKVA